MMDKWVDAYLSWLDEEGIPPCAHDDGRADFRLFVEPEVFAVMVEIVKDPDVGSFAEWTGECISAYYKGITLEIWPKEV